MTELYEALCDLFIRPTKQQYSPYDLGCPLIGAIGRRRDFIITNSRGFKLQCSYYEPVGRTTNEAVVYLHSLNGCRLQCIRLPEYFLSEGIGFASLDFTACGNSEGQYVSLGCHETEDTLEFIEYLHHTYKIKSFALWGRSMGAVTAIKFADLYERQFGKESHYLASAHSVAWSLVAMVLDSPFSNLHKLALEIADRKMNIPSFLVKAVLLFVRRSIQEKANFKFQQLNLKNYISRLVTPVMILASKDDELISFKHSEEIFNGYGGKDKQLEYIEGNHNQYRSQELITKLAVFMLRRFENNRKKKRESSVEDLRKRLISIKSSAKNLTILAPNKSYTTLNASSLTPTSKPSARQSESKQKYYGFRTTKKRQHDNSENTKYDSASLEKQYPEAYSNENEHIHIDSRAHYNIIHQKLGNMKKKGFLAASPLQKKHIEGTPEVKRKHTISLSKSPVLYGLSHHKIQLKQECPIYPQAPFQRVSHQPHNEPNVRTIDIKNSIMMSGQKHSMPRLSKKTQFSQITSRRESDGYYYEQVVQQALISTPTK